MKQSEIQVGKTYSNGKKGRFYQERKIIAEGPDYILYSGQENRDCIRFKVIIGSYKLYPGVEGNMTRLSFAHWAKEVIENETD